MHQSANDILSISTNRETVLIGPPGAFGVIHRDDVLVGRGEIERAIAHIFTIPGIEDVMRANARRFGMEASALTRLDRSALRTWLSGQAVRGALAIAIVPDPVVAFSAYVHRQEHAMDQASSLRRTLPEEDEALPRDMERRFLIVMDMVPDHLHGEARKKFNDLVQAAGMESIAVGLLIWLGAHFVPGLNLVVLAFDLFFLSGEVLRAMEMVGHCIEQVQKATKRSELEEVAKVLAAAIAVLVVNGVLSRLLRAKQVTRGQTQSTSRGRGGFDKPKVEHRPVRQSSRRPTPKPQDSPSQAAGAGPARAGGAGGGAGGPGGSSNPPPPGGSGGSPPTGDGGVFGPGTLTKVELDEIQGISDKHNANIDVVGSRAEGRGRNIDKPELPAGKGDDTRSDIDMRIDGDDDIRSRGMLSNDISNASNGAGSVASSTGLPSTPPFIKIRPGQKPEHVK